MPTMSWTCYHGILHSHLMRFARMFVLYLDTSYKPSKQVKMIDKIQSFLGKMAHKAIVDMGVHALPKQSCGHVVQWGYLHL